MKKNSKISKDLELGFLSLFVIAILAIGTVFYHFIENWSWIDSLYFSVITLTTVGFGDFVPTSPLSKIFTIGYIIVGIGIILGFINIVARRGLRRNKGKR